MLHSRKEGTPFKSFRKGKGAQNKRHEKGDEEERTANARRKVNQKVAVERGQKMTKRKRISAGKQCSS